MAAAVIDASAVIAVVTNEAQKPALIGVGVIERAEDGSYWAYLPDLPGCATCAETPVQVEHQLHEAVELYLSYFHERGLPLPQPQARVGTLTAA